MRKEKMLDLQNKLSGRADLIFFGFIGNELELFCPYIDFKRVSDWVTACAHAFGNQISINRRL